MADIEFVVRLDQETLQDLYDSRYVSPHIKEVFRNATPLPKGHGDLKDMDDIYEALEGWNDDTGWIVDAIDCQAQTIIKADTQADTQNKEKFEEREV